MEMEKVYNPQSIEGDLYKEWEESGAFVRRGTKARMKVVPRKRSCVLWDGALAFLLVVTFQRKWHEFRR